MTHAFTVGGAGIGGPWPHPQALRKEALHMLKAMAESWGGHHGKPHDHEQHERRHRGHRGPRGFGWDFGPGPWAKSFVFGGGRPGWSRGRKAKRGDVRAAILALLSEEPRNGYQIIQEIAERSAGIWRPSPGSVYPALQQLEDEGLVLAEESAGSRVYRLTDEGRAYVAERADELAAPWTQVANSLPEEMAELRLLWAQVNQAFGQLTQVANANQVAAANRLLRQTRRSIFKILAEDDLEGTDDR